MSALSGPLDSVIDLASAFCFNENTAHPVGNCFLDDESYLQSDADHQLLLQISFSEPVHVSGIQLTASGEEAPSSMKLFINQPNFGFDDCENEAAVENLTWTQGDVKNGTVLPLRITRFQNVHSLQIFVEENHGAEVTRIQRLRVLGARLRAPPPQAGRIQRGKPRHQKTGPSTGVGAADVATRLTAATTEEGAARIIEDVVATSQPRGREVVRQTTGVFLDAAVDVGERRRRALRLLGACCRLQLRYEGQGSKAKNRIRQMASQGILAGLEKAVDSVQWTAVDIMGCAPPLAALQLLRAMPSSSVICDIDSLQRFLVSLLTGTDAKPHDVVLVGEWIADGLQEESMASHFRQLAKQFGGLIVAPAMDDRWSAVAKEAMTWMPQDLQSDELRNLAGRAAGKQLGSQSIAQEWTVDLNELPPYSLPSEMSVIFVDTLEGLGRMSEKMASCAILSVDTEFGSDESVPLALIQVACEDVCYLVDARPSLGLEFRARLRDVLNVVFDRSVLGWSFKEDSRRLALLDGSLKPLLSRVRDLQPLARRRLGLLQTPSLQRACAELMGVALDKGQQRSDWIQRPLTESQLHYAACDAAVLFSLARVLGEDHGLEDGMPVAELQLGEEEEQ